MRLFRRFRASDRPAIPPVAGEIHARPYWSVMIPTYNSGKLLERMLRSVLDQDPGSDRMQIAVVDDGSTGRNHEETVRRLAPKRVELFRQASNRGLAANWNECIARSRGRWVHILHQDDLVLPGFYEAFVQPGLDPAVGAAFCRHLYIDSEDRHEGVSILHQETAGVLPNWLDKISRHQYIQCPAVVVRRDVYETLGGFATDLCFALDWEMWVRIAANYAVWFDPRPLACYRWHDESETKRLKRADLDIIDLLKAVKIVQQRVPAAYRSTVGSDLLSHFRQTEMAHTCEAFREGNLRTGIASFRRAIRCDRSLRFSRVGYAYYKWALKIWLAALVSRKAPEQPECFAIHPENHPIATNVSPRK
jgi:glycosyltransferase involved in cell wall biosynthesis